jgi:hypothetical protein
VADLTPRERFVVVSVTAAVAVGGLVFGFASGGVGEALFIGIVCGVGAFLGAYLPARSMAKARQR